MISFTETIDKGLKQESQVLPNRLIEENIEVPLWNDNMVTFTGLPLCWWKGKQNATFIKLLVKLSECIFMNGNVCWEFGQEMALLSRIPL